MGCDVFDTTVLASALQTVSVWVAIVRHGTQTECREIVLGLNVECSCIEAIGVDCCLCDELLHPFHLQFDVFTHSATTNDALHSPQWSHVDWFELNEFDIPNFDLGMPLAELLEGC